MAERDPIKKIEFSELKNSYPLTCPGCGGEINARPSLLMHMGLNRGGGACSKCKAYLVLEINSQNDGMIAQLHSEKYPEVTD